MMAKTEELRMTSPDFVGGLLGYWGARLDSDGAWRLPTGQVVSLGRSPWYPQAESGWHRWQLPGVDGITRGRLVDRNAPFILCSPDGRWFWCGPRGCYMQWIGVCQLIDMAAAHAIDRRARLGWTNAAAVRILGGTA